MRDVRIDQTIERSGWGLLFIWVGTAFLANVGWGWGLTGVGLIMLGAQAARTWCGLKIDLLGLALGQCFAAAGLMRLVDLQ